MHRLILLRHAKAESDSASGRDRDRVLSERGRHDADRAGPYLVAHRLVPDLALVSPAARTRETWARVQAGLPRAVPTAFVEDLYNADIDDLYAALRQADEAARVVALVGHNPGLHLLGLQLADLGNAPLREKLSAALPPGTVVALDFAARPWAAVAEGTGRLAHYCIPAEMVAEGSR